MNRRRFSLTHITPDHIAGAISYLHRTGQSCMSRELDGLPLRAGSTAFLLHLYTREGEYQDEFARALGYDKATTARAYQALEQDGLVRRVRDEADRRRTRLYLTEAGYEVRLKAVKAAHALNETLLDGMDEAERRETARLLGLMVQNLDRTRVAGEAEK
jgi:DNA-binding MarR family transcriptional regulator